MLLRKKAAEELKKEQERKAAERRRIIEERCGRPKNIEDASEGKVTILITRISYLNTFIHLNLFFQYQIKFHKYLKKISPKNEKNQVQETFFFVI